MANAKSQPINFLQEFCQKYCKTSFPKYFKAYKKLKNCDGIPLHYCKCNFYEYTIIKVATNMKLAKRLAATGMVNYLSEIKYFEKFGCFINSTGEVEFTDDPVSATNPISALQEHCQRSKLEVMYIERPSGNLEFAYECTVKDLFTLGQGVSKKLAKRRAAAQMCDFLNITYDRSEPIEYECAPIITMPMNHTPVSVLEKFCEFNAYLEPQYEVYSNPVAGHDLRFTVVCRVEDLASGRGSALTVKIAKTLAVENVFEDFIQEGYAPEIAEYMIGNLLIWDKAPILALKALCFCFIQKPTFKYKKDYNGNFEVVIQVDDIKAIGRSSSKLKAKSMAADKVLEIYLLQSFPIENQEY